MADTEMAAPAEHAASYEFDETENRILTGVQTKMSFVGIVYAAWGGVYLFLVLLAGEFIARHFSSLKLGVAGALGYALLVIDSSCRFGSGVFTKLAANGLREVVETTGNDIPNMMRALGSLRTMYWMYAVTLAVDIGTDIVEVVTK